MEASLDSVSGAQKFTVSSQKYLCYVKKKQAKSG